MAYIEVLGHSADLGVTLHLFSDQNRYLFNCGEGAQRICLASGVRLSKLHSIFLTRSAWTNMGGLPGMLLTLPSVAPDIHIKLHAPPGLELLTSHMHSFVNASYINYDYQLKSKPKEFAEDGYLQLSSFTVPCEAEVGAVKHTVCYVGHFRDVAGTINMKKVKALGLKPGPWLSLIKAGQPVTAACGDGERLVQPEEVVDSLEKNPLFAVVECPSLAFASALRKDGQAARFFADSGRGGIVFHVVPREIAAGEDYQQWMLLFGEGVEHVLLDSQNGQPSAFEASCEKQQSIRHLSLASPTFPEPQLILNTINPSAHPVPQTPSDRALIDAPLPRNMSQPGAGQRFVLVNTSKGKAGWHAGPKNTPTPVPDDPEAALAAIPGFAALEKVRREALQAHAAEEPSPGSDKCSLQSVLFLGTGSAAPSKYRNVTGILASAVGGHVMLDAGEGTAGQLLRALGAAGADATLRELKLIFLSHMHADHHLGTTGLLLARRRAYERVGQPPVPLLLIAPAEYERFFRAIATLHPPAMEGVTLVNGLQLYGGCNIPKQAVPTAAVEGRAAALPPAALLPHGGDGPGAAPADVAGHVSAAAGASLRDMGVKAIRTVPVLHRGRAMGLVVDFESGERLVWSGDTRPCRALVEAGRGATLLIHEATFEESLREDALAKRHSTTQEALSVAAQMGAQNVILTHFSQRYPQVPGEDKASAGGPGDGTGVQGDEVKHGGLRAAHEFTVPDNFDAPVLYAFDLMHVNLAHTRAMAQDVPLLRCVFDYLSTLEDGMDTAKGDSSPSNATKAWPRGTGHGRRRKGNKDETGSKRAKITAGANRTAEDDAASSETRNGAGNT